MTPRVTSRAIIAAVCMLAGTAGMASAGEVLREVYFHDLARTRVGNMIIVQSNPETEILVFSGGELALGGDNLMVIARHARLDGDTVIRAHILGARMPMPGQPDQAARGADGMKDGDKGGNGAPGGAGAAGEEGAAAGKVVLRIGEVSGDGRLIVDMSGQGGGKGQNGGQGGDGGNGRNGRARACGGDEPQNGGDGGWGGIGGQGGQGGRGGNGGIVAYSAAMAPLIKSKHFIVKTEAGAPGAGGNPGQPGNPGSGGLGGAGAIGCGAGGSDGAQGGQTSGAQPGKAGSPGTNGTSLQEQAP
jgi:hypothetical protein